MNVSTNRAWAIATRYVDIDGRNCDGFLGRYYFSHDVPQHFGGIRTATWATREDARAALAKLKGLWAEGGYSPCPNATVVSVLVVATEDGRR